MLHAQTKIRPNVAIFSRDNLSNAIVIPAAIPHFANSNRPGMLSPVPTTDSAEARISSNTAFSSRLSFVCSLGWMMAARIAPAANSRYIGTWTPGR